MYLRKAMLLGLSVIGVILAVGWISTPRTQSKDGAPDKAVEVLFPETNDSKPESKIEDLTKDFSDMEKSLESSQARLRRIEERLGPTTRRPTLATSFERRLEDVEKRLTRIEQQLAKLQNLEQRVRKLERQN